MKCSNVLQQSSEDQTLQAVALMQQGQIVDLNATIALTAAKLSLAHRLPMADSVMLATAQSCNAILWTQDADFGNVAGVRYVAKQQA